MVNCCLQEYGQGKLFAKSFPWNPSKTFNNKQFLKVLGGGSEAATR